MGMTGSDGEEGINIHPMYEVRHTKVIIANIVHQTPYFVQFLKVLFQSFSLK